MTIIEKRASKHRAYRLGVESRKNLKVISRNITLHIDGGLNPLPWVNEQVLEKRKYLNTLKVRHSYVQKEFVKSLIQQHIEVEETALTELLRNRKRVYNKNRNRRKVA